MLLALSSVCQISRSLSPAKEKNTDISHQKRLSVAAAAVSVSTTVHDESSDALGCTTSTEHSYNTACTTGGCKTSGCDDDGSMRSYQSSDELVLKLQKTSEAVTAAAEITEDGL